MGSVPLAPLELVNFPRKVIKPIGDRSFIGLHGGHCMFVIDKHMAGIHRHTVKLGKKPHPAARYIAAYKSGKWDGFSWQVDFDTVENANLFKLLYGRKSLVNTLAQVKSRAEELFKKPGLLAKVEALQERFVAPAEDGHLLLGELQNAIVEQSEWDFEQQIIPFPYVVEVPKAKFLDKKYRLNKTGEPSPKFNELESWLAKNIPADEYLAFPSTAAGKHKDCCFNVYFKTLNWATYFKVGCPF